MPQFKEGDKVRHKISKEEAIVQGYSEDGRVLVSKGIGQLWTVPENQLELVTGFDSEKSDVQKAAEKGWGTIHTDKNKGKNSRPPSSDESVHG